jgi:hypothetical protein
MHRCSTEPSRRYSRAAGLLTAALFALPLLAGCGSDFAPVSGRVTMNGKALPNAVVTFQPGGKRGAPPPTATGSVGRTDAEGNYSLRVISPDKPGALVGEHAVTISISPGEAGAKQAKAQPLPKGWQDGSRRFTVPPEGTSSADFDIK